MKQAFTIIELIVAAAIVVLLVSVAVPRYNKFSAQQDFNRSAQTIENCLQRGQQEAASPSQFRSAALAYAVSTMTNDSTNGAVICSLDLYSTGATFDTKGAYLAGGTHISSLAVSTVAGAVLCTVNSSALNVPVSPPDTVRVRFDALSRGVPGSMFATVGANGYGKASAFGSGLDVALTLAPYNKDIPTSCAAPLPTSATINMSRLGVPIQLCTTYGTSCL